MLHHTDGGTPRIVGHDAHVVAVGVDARHVGAEYLRGTEAVSPAVTSGDVTLATPPDNFMRNR